MTKKKLIISLSALVLVIAIGVIGVLAAATQNATLSNHLTFVAKDIKATVVVSLTNNGSAVNLDGENATKTFIFEHNTTTAEALTPAAQAFEGVDSTIVYTFSITNTGDNPMTIGFTGIPAIDTVTSTTTCKLGLNDFALNTDTLEKGDGTVVITATLTLNDGNISFDSGEFDLVLTMTGTNT